MNYKNIYSKFIQKYKNQIIPKGIYTERHHIVPRGHGGDDGEDNLIVLTYRQHVFAHHVLWRAYNKPSDLMAYLLMSGTEVDVRRVRQSANGRSNVLSGHLDRIRPMANTLARQEKLAKMNKLKWESDEGLKAVRLANEAWRGKHHTEEFKETRSRNYKNRFQESFWKEYGVSLAEQGRQVRTEQSVALSDKVLSVDNPKTEYLKMKAKRSKNLFISPTGLVFDSPKFAAKYFNDVVSSFVIDNWCKRGQHGWKRKPKPDDSNEVI